MQRYLIFIIFFILLFLLAHNFHGQKEIDSLLVKLKTDRHDTSKVNLYKYLCYKYNIVNTDSALYFGKKALKLAYDIKYYKGIGGSCLNLGAIYYYKGNISISFFYYNNALIVF